MIYHREMTEKNITYQLFQFWCGLVAMFQIQLFHKIPVHRMRK